MNVGESKRKCENYYEFPVEILFKDIDNIRSGDIYELEYYLLSDREGKIESKNNGKLQIKFI